jgi:peptide/nickel transport system permease protein
VVHNPGIPDRRRRAPVAPAWARRGGATLATVAATILGLLFVTFMIGRVMPIDPVLAVIGERATQEQYDETFRALGLDQPLLVQFGIYVGDVLQGDFGRSIRTGQLVSDDIARVFPATLRAGDARHADRRAARHPARRDGGGVSRRAGSTRSRGWSG